MTDNTQIVANSPIGTYPVAVDKDALGNERQAVGIDIGAVNPITGVWTPSRVSATNPLPTTATLAPGGSVTVVNGAGASAVNIQDGGNSITVDGAVSVSNGAGASAVNIQDGGNSITTDLPDLTAIDFNFGAGAVCKQGYFDTVNGWWSALTGDDQGRINTNVTGSVITTTSGSHSILANVVGTGTTTLTSLGYNQSVYIAVRGTYAGVTFTVEGEADSGTGVVTTMPLVRVANPLVAESTMGPLTNIVRVWQVVGGISLSRIRLNVSAYTSGTANFILIQQNGSELGNVAFQGGTWSVAQSGAWTVDTELPTAVLLADNTATPTAPAVGAFGMMYDRAGSNWDLLSATTAAPALQVSAQVVTISPGYDVLSANLTASGQVLQLDGYEQIEFEFSNTFTNGSVIFEAFTTGSTYTSYPCRYSYLQNTTTFVSGSSYTYRFRASSLMKNKFRLRCTGLTSGTITITAHCFRIPVLNDNIQVWGQVSVSSIGSVVPTYPTAPNKLFWETGSVDFGSISGPGAGSLGTFYVNSQNDYTADLTNTTDQPLLCSVDNGSSYFTIPPNVVFSVRLIEMGGYLEAGHDIMVAYEATAPTKGSLTFYGGYY